MIDNQNTQIQLAQKVIEESVKAAKEFLGRLINPALEEGGGIISDTMKLWRLKNLVKITIKAKKFLEERGIKPERVLPKTLLPIIENGSLEEDDDMRNRWSAMLAHAADPSSEVKIRPGYPSILKELSPLEVKILDDIYKFIKGISEEKRKNAGILKEKVLQAFKISSEEYDIIADNLFRLNLCQPPSSEGGTTIDKYPLVLRTYDFIKLTPLGVDFIRACKY